MRRPPQGPIVLADDDREVDALEANDIAEAERYWIRQAQIEKYPIPFKELSEGRKNPKINDLKTLRPIWDAEDKLIRAKGRIELAFRDLNVKPPILLPDRHIISDMIVEDMHLRVFHSGVRTTHAELLERFYLVRGKQQVKRVINRCETCKRFNARPYSAPPAPLPIDRIREANPFEIVGVDFAGPLLYAPEGSSRRPPAEVELKKAYICLFTCAVTRAVHLEIVPNLEAGSFLFALRRFFARRGVSSVIYSDNAKTFKRSEKYLENLHRHKRVNDYLVNNKIEWRFSASLAPWWGGWWERMVRITKDMLRKMLGKTTLGYAELEVTLHEIERAINARPLTYVTEGDSESLPLTPSALISAHRIAARPMRPIPELTEESSSHDSLIERNRNRRRNLADFWKRWQKEYLLDLKRFHAPTRKGRLPQVGEKVIIHDENAKRLDWLTGVITRVAPGRDGIHRIAWVKTSNGDVRDRPIQRLYPLEIQYTGEDVPEAVPAANDPDSPEDALQPEEPTNAPTNLDDHQEEEGQDEHPTGHLYQLPRPRSVLDILPSETRQLGEDGPSECRPATLYDLSCHVIVPTCICDR